MSGKSIALGTLSLLFVTGCGHRGEVEDMILSKYASMSDGGSVKFVSYEESHTTEWGVRTFRAKGKVRWEKPWYLVLRKWASRDGVPELVLVSPYAELNEGVLFDAVFYRGKTDRKGDVTVYLKDGDKYTEDGLAKKYPNGIFVLENGKCMKRRVDGKTYGKALESSLSRLDQKIKAILRTCDERKSKVAEYLDASFADFNEEALDAYIKSGGDLCVELGGALTGADDVLRKNEYFVSFPVADMGQAEAKDMAQKLESEIQKVKDVIRKVEARYDEARKESADRRRKGVRFLRGVPKRNAGGGGTAGNGSTIRMGTGKVVVSDLAEESGNAAASGDGASAGLTGTRRNKRSVNPPRPSRRHRQPSTPADVPVEIANPQPVKVIRLPAASPL